MTSILDLPELRALDGAGSLIRIPNQIDVPVTPRVMRLIDSPQFQRLRNIRQLGLVSFVYPGAHHNRFEHSLGVYRMALLFLRQLANDVRFQEIVAPRDATTLILAALLHDLGHWPFCHPMEDLRLARMPTHEEWGKKFLQQKSMAELIVRDWDVEPEQVVALIEKRPSTPAGRLLSSVLSGPIDIDKMDYLYRDSLHCGVPYGQNFDSPRLIRSLCIDDSGERLAITEKGKTAAELMVFARYVMFSEVYWHHAVRSATAMFQRAFFRWYQTLESLSDQACDDRINKLLTLPEQDLIRQLRLEGNSAQHDLLESLFGESRQLFKRLATFSCFDGESVYRNIARRPYAWLVDLSQELAAQFSSWLGLQVRADQVLVDAPPVGLEVQFDVQVRYVKENRHARLEEVSPVVQTLAKRQFDDFVKQVRIFVDPEISAGLKAIPDLKQRIAEALTKPFS